MRETLTVERELAYTTVMTVMDNLHSKGLVTREKHGKAYLYSHVSSRAEHTASRLHEVLTNSRDRTAALQHRVGKMNRDEGRDGGTPAPRLRVPGVLDGAMAPEPTVGGALAASGSHRLASGVHVGRGDDAAGRDRPGPANPAAEVLLGLPHGRPYADDRRALRDSLRELARRSRSRAGGVPHRDARGHDDSQLCATRDCCTVADVAARS
jgi:hypothetical protein